MGIDVPAGELHGGFGAALERDVGQLHMTDLLDHAGQDFVGVLGLRAAHLEVARCGRLQIVACGLVGRVLLDPEQELILRHGGDRGQIGVVEGDLGDERLLPGIRRAEDHLVGIARGGLAVDIAFRAAAAGLVDDDDRLVRQLVLGDDVLHRAGDIVGAAARTCGCHELDRLLGLPRRERGRAACCDGRTDGQQKQRRPTHDFLQLIFCDLFSVVSTSAQATRSFRCPDAETIAPSFSSASICCWSNPCSASTSRVCSP